MVSSPQLYMPVLQIIYTNCTVDETQIPYKPDDVTYVEGYTQDEGVCTCDNKDVLYLYNHR